jgi:transposase
MAEYKTVKTSLKNILKYEADEQAIMDAVLTGHKLVQHASHWIKLYILHLKSINQELPQLDQKFIMCIFKTICTKATNMGRPPNEATKELMKTLETFHLTHYKPLMHNEVIHLNSDYENMLKYIADSMVTCFETNIKQHFVEYVERFVNIVMDKKATITTLASKEEKRAFASDLRRYKTLLLSNTRQGLPPQLLPHAAHIVPQRTFKKSSVAYDIKCSPQDYFGSMFYMTQFVEEKGEAIYSLFPLRSGYIPRYVALDTCTIVKLLLPKGIPGYTKSGLLKGGNMKENEDNIWAACFKTEMRIFRKKNYKFDHRISTDGVGVSVLLIQREKKKKGGGGKDEQMKEPYLHEMDAKEMKTYQTKNKVGIDPNMDDIIFCSGKNQEENMQHFRYTRNQRKVETKTKKYRKIQEKLKMDEVVDGKSVEEWQTTLSVFNKKTLNFDAFSDYVRANNEVSQKVSNFYQQKIFRKLKWNGYINRQKTEGRMIRRFRSIYGAPTTTDIYIGDWEQIKHRKFKEPSIGKGIRKLFRKAGYRVTLVDEFRTSCMCYNCQSEEGRCQTFRRCPNPKPWKAEETTTRHGLLMCQTCLGLWNRDVNSSLNIRRIVEDTLAGKGRPEYLLRSRPRQQDGGVTSTSGNVGIPVNSPVEPRHKKPKLSTNQTT